MAKKTTTTEPTQPLYVLITETREHGYLHLYGRIVTPRYEQGDQQPYSPDDTYSDGTLYSGLQLRCQGDDQSRARAMAGERDAPVYGFDCEYRDCYSVDRRRAVRMAKTLVQLEKQLDKLTEKRGYVRTYGEYVGRVAEAFGCQGIAFERDRRSRDVTGQRWCWDSIGYGVDRVERLVQAWVDEAKPKPAPAAATEATDDAQGVA